MSNYLLPQLEALAAGDTHVRLELDALRLDLSGGFAGTYAEELAWSLIDRLGRPTETDVWALIDELMDSIVR